MVELHTMYVGDIGSFRYEIIDTGHYVGNVTGFKILVHFSNVPTIHKGCLYILVKDKVFPLH